MDRPQYGAIAIFHTGHAGFYYGPGVTSSQVTILHGNWGGKVEKSTYIEKSLIKEYRFPK